MIVEQIAFREVSRNNPTLNMKRYEVKTEITFTTNALTPELARADFIQKVINHLNLTNMTRHIDCEFEDIKVKELPF